MTGRPVASFPRAREQSPGVADPLGAPPEHREACLPVGALSRSVSMLLFLRRINNTLKPSKKNIVLLVEDASSETLGPEVSRISGIFGFREVCVA